MNETRTCDICGATDQPTIELFDDETGFVETRCRNTGACTDRQDAQYDAFLARENARAREAQS